MLQQKTFLPTTCLLHTSDHRAATSRPALEELPYAACAQHHLYPPQLSFSTLGAIATTARFRLADLKKVANSIPHDGVYGSTRYGSIGKKHRIRCQDNSEGSPLFAPTSRFRDQRPHHGVVSCRRIHMRDG